MILSVKLDLPNDQRWYDGEGAEDFASKIQGKGKLLALAEDLRKAIVDFANLQQPGELGDLRTPKKG